MYQRAGDFFLISIFHAIIDWSTSYLNCEREDSMISLEMALAASGMMSWQLSPDEESGWTSGHGSLWRWVYTKRPPPSPDKLGQCGDSWKNENGREGFL